MPQYVVRPSVRQTVCNVRDQIGWHSSKIISRPNSSLRPLLGPSGATGTPQNWGGIGVGSLGRAKTCNISETVKILPRLLVYNMD